MKTRLFRSSVMLTIILASLPAYAQSVYTNDIYVTGGSLASANLVKSPPTFGAFLGNAGAGLELCTAVVCLTDGHLLGEHFFTNTTLQDASYGEYTATINTVINTGLLRPWTASTSYALNQEVSANSNIYNAITAGVSGATAPSGTGSSIPDGSVVWAYVAPITDNQGKVGLFLSTTANGPSGNFLGAGGSWGLADDFVLNSGAYVGTGAFYAGAEFDFGNYAGNCEIGVSNCYGIFIYGITSYPITASIAISTPATSNYAGHYGLLLNGANVADTADIEDSSSGPIGLDFGGLLGSHSTATIQDNTSGGLQSILIAGSHTAQDISIATTSPKGYADTGSHSTASIYLAGTSANGIETLGTYSTSQISGRGYSISPTGALTAKSSTATIAHLTVAASPTLGSCGTLPSTATGSSNQGGEITTGSGATTCEVKFATPYPNKAFCVITATTAGSTAYISASSPSSFTISSAGASKTYNYACNGN